MSYHNDQFSVEINPAVLINWSAIPGVIKAVQVFPGRTDGLENMYQVYVDPFQYDQVKSLLKQDRAIVAVEKVSITFTSDDGEQTLIQTIFWEDNTHSWTEQDPRLGESDMVVDPPLNVVNLFESRKKS